MQDNDQILSNAPFSVVLPPSPYPGLRPFEKNEWPIFFGRESMTTHVIDHLMDNRFVVVHGDSGCGKSSLIRAGVLVQLEQEQARLDRKWITTDMKPGDSPLWRLAKALCRGQDKQVEQDFRRLLNLGREAAPALAKDLRLAGNQRLCILVDQFEELFRFTSEKNIEEAQLFTDVLVGLERFPLPGLYIILTMRSEFMGHCGRFRGLAETINRSQYLLPRMERPALMRAIREPARLYGADVSVFLAHTLIAEAGGGQDRLPLIQHSLMRLWNRAMTNANAQTDHIGSTHSTNTSSEDAIRFTISTTDFEMIGGLRNALSNHANEVYNELAPGDKNIAQAIFQVLTVHESERPDLRRPTPFGRVVDIITDGKSTQRDRDRVKRVVESFSRTDRSFITPAKGTPLEDDVFLDIGHESLIRQWDKLKQWAKEEGETAETYRELLRQTIRWQKERWLPWKIITGSELLHGRRYLKRVAHWRNQTNTSWATLYGGNYDGVKRLISASHVYFFIKWAVYLALITSLLFIYYQYRRNQQEAALASSKREMKIAQEFAGAAMRRESELWAILSLSQTAKGFSTAGLILAFDALHSDEVERPYVHKAERALYAALHVPHEIMILEGHEGVVEVGAFSPHGKLVATGSWGKTARIWNAETGELIHTLEGHSGALTHLAFSPNNAYLVTSARDPMARIWDVHTGALVHELRGHERMVRYSAFNPEGDKVVTASADFTSRIWDVQSGAELHVLRGHDDVVEQAIFSPRGNSVLTVSWDKTARIWNAKTGELIHILRGHESAIKHAAFNAGGDRVVTASADKTARIWDAQTGGQLQVVRDHSDEVLYAAFSSRGDRVITASRDNTARIWDAAKGMEIVALQGHTGAVHHAEFSPKDDMVVTASEDNSARLWDAETGASIYPLNRHEDKLSHAYFSPHGDRVLTVSHDGTARIWYTRDNIMRGHKDAIVDAAFSPDGNLIVTASMDNTARLWRVSSRKELLVLKGHKGPVLSASFSPQGDRVVTASEDATARIWDTESGNPVLVLQKHQGPVLSVAFSPETGDRIVTASADNTARIWDARTGAEINVLTGHTGEVVQAEFSPQGDRVVTASRDQTACIWNASSGERSIVFQHHKDEVLSAKFGPGGRIVATASKDRTVCLWDPDTGELIRSPLSVHITAVVKIAFSKDEKRLKDGKIIHYAKRLVSVDKSKTALLWNLDGLKAKTADQELTPMPDIDSPEPFAGRDRRPFNLNHEGTATNAMFSPRGNRVVTASEDGKAVIWDVETADPVAVLEGCKSALNAAVFSFDGRFVLTAAEDGTMRLWEVFEDTEALVRHAQKVINGRTLSLEEHERIFPY